MTDDTKPSVTLESKPDANPVATMRDAMETHLPANRIAGTCLALFDAAKDRQIIDKTDDEYRYHRFLDRLNPPRRMGTARLDTLQSTIDWANRFKGDTSTLFLHIDRPSSSSTTDMTGASRSARGQGGSASQSEVTIRSASVATTGGVQLIAVANYHAGGPPADTDIEDEATARHGDHRGEYNFPVSEAWKRWTGMAGQSMDVPSFGRFIEDNARDLLDPTPFIVSGDTPVGDDEDAIQNWEIEARKVATRLKGNFATVSRMIDLGRSFGVVVDEKLSVKVDRQSGRANMVIHEDHTDEQGEPLGLPRLFLIAIPVFEMGDLFPLICTFSYSARGGVKLSFDLYDATAAFDDAITEVAVKATAETGLPLLYGLPE